MQQQVFNRCPSWLFMVQQRHLSFLGVKQYRQKQERKESQLLLYTPVGLKPI